VRAVKRNIILIICFTALFACNNEQETTDEKLNSDSLVTIENAESLDTTSKTKEIKITKPKDYTAKYICPSRCANSGSDKLGDCPNCGMELMENPNSQKIIKKETTKK